MLKNVFLVEFQSCSLELRTIGCQNLKFQNLDLQFLADREHYQNPRKVEKTPCLCPI